ncbi:MAG: adaptor protein MecA [Lachnospiraceae bacterium]|nr:adaptor protein MecA [Lachnospiraceae bacterium]
MRLEKLSDNKIKCILDKDDLTSRGIRISELAYGSEKTRELFADMMQQASSEFGFEAEDSPLMIEAIPALDRLVLVITKVDNPDEIDSRFSRFSPDPVGEYFDDEDEEELDYPDTLDESLNDEFIPLAKALGIDLDADKAKEEVKEIDESKMPVVFSFNTLSEVCSVCAKIASQYAGPSSAYKNKADDRYYLLVVKTTQSSDDFGKVIRLLSEFGKLEKTTYATKSFMDEHYETIVKDNAVGILKDL